MMSEDEIFDALGASQRRRLLLALFNKEPQRVSELSGATTDLAQAHETFIDEYLSGSVDFPEVDRDRLRTHHVHLPKLAQYGFIEWDREAGLVRKGRRFEELTPILELLAEGEDDQAAELVV